MNVSLPDENGMVSLGTSVDCSYAAIKMADIVIGVMNPNVPFAYGDLVPLSSFTYLVQDDAPLVTAAFAEPTPTEVLIGRNCAARVDDGDCLQMGIGALPNALAAQLGNHKDLGSCVTALMSSFGAATNARRTSMIHLMFNTFGSAIFMVILLAFPGFMGATFGRWFATPSTQIAMFHTFFNVICTVIFLPLSEGFVMISQKIIPEAKEEEAFTYLDERMLLTPALAIEQLKRQNTCSHI